MVKTLPKQTGKIYLPLILVQVFQHFSVPPDAFYTLCIFKQSMNPIAKFLTFSYVSHVNKKIVR